MNAPEGHCTPGTGGYVLFTQLASRPWLMTEWAIRMASLEWNRRALERVPREDGSDIMVPDGLTPVEGNVMRGDAGLWVRSRIVYRVQQAETLLLSDAAADSLAQRGVGRGRVD